MNTSYLPETINLHFLSACEMGCTHCFAPFVDCGKLSLSDLKALILKLAQAPRTLGMPKARRLNFVGGEPTLHPHFLELVQYAHKCGLSTSIVTNGYSLIRNGIPKELKVLELVGVSIDSLDHARNRKIGRVVRQNTISENQWYLFFGELSQMGVSLKINTTITQHNVNEDFTDFIRKTNPSRWKVFQAMVVRGQNCKGAEHWKVSRKEYDSFIERHLNVGSALCAEPEELMRGSYAMISPDGRFFDSAEGYQRYSDSILEVGIEQAWNQVQCDADLFLERTRNY
ncbi:MAG: hypothetical protein CML13_09035 [Puniceicoccaceae bacterium]|nr:hypothetical protein [Puniceicoccaceae bacterium]